MALIRSRFRVRAFSRVACCLRVAAAMALMALVTAPPATAQADAGALSGAAKIHYQRAAEELRSGDAEAALLELDQAVQLAPDSARVLRLYARALAQAGQSARMREILARLEAIDSPGPIFRYELALARIRAADIASARDLLVASASSSPEPGRA